MSFSCTVIRRCILFAVCLLCFPLCYAQDFTLDNEFIKQHKKYRFITRYISSDSGLLSGYDIGYTKVDGRVLTFDMFCSESSNNHQPVLFIHGGGWSSGSKRMDHQMAKALAQRGFVTFCIDYRKSGEAKYPAAVDDIKNAIRWIKSHSSQYNIDPSRICLVGTSAGGQMAALIGCNADSDSSCHVQRVIDIDGVLCFIHPDSSEGKDSNGKISSATRWFGVSAAEGKALWDSASAMYNVNQKSADFLFINSAQPRFSAGQSETVKRLREYGKVADVIRTSATPHTFWLFNPWAQSLIDDMVNWLSK